MEREEVMGAVARGWCHPDTGRLVMDEVLALAIVDEMMPLFKRDTPLLGLATTRQLLEELTTRIDVDYLAGGGGLDYTTVRGRPVGLIDG